MDIRAAQISAILKEQMKNFGQEAEGSEIGQVLSVGDGIARVYGLVSKETGDERLRPVAHQYVLRLLASCHKAAQTDFFWV